eukprot:TRINITY_DN12192_c1_g1_i1.p3 TRINITY_DN12192_c1_g1~~TRINITY_DN12192_c1_g1_i1.p3  ORF type:complete len:126 (-),score=5.47 TRINITY_DN12192_c1_g1_i1:38-364(-)
MQMSYYNKMNSVLESEIEKERQKIRDLRIHYFVAGDSESQAERKGFVQNPSHAAGGEVNPKEKNERYKKERARKKRKWRRQKKRRRLLSVQQNTQLCRNLLFWTKLKA